MRQAGFGSIAGQSEQPTAPPKLRGLPRAGFAATNHTNALRTLKFGNAPWRIAACGHYAPSAAV